MNENQVNDLSLNELCSELNIKINKNNKNNNKNKQINKKEIENNEKLEKEELNKQKQVKQKEEIQEEQEEVEVQEEREKEKEQDIEIKEEKQQVQQQEKEEEEDNSNVMSLAEFRKKSEELTLYLETLKSNTYEKERYEEELQIQHLHEDKVAALSELNDMVSYVNNVKSTFTPPSEKEKTKKEVSKKSSPNGITLTGKGKYAKSKSSSSSSPKIHELSNNNNNNNNSNSNSNSNNMKSTFLLGEVECWSDTRRSTICTFAGPSGYGKRTLVRAIANELKRSVQIVHVSELLSGSGGGRRGGELADTIESVENLLHDARISDSVVGIDGFEHVLDDSSSNNDSGMKLTILLSRLLDIFILFPGLIILICHVDNPQNLILHKEFSSRIFSFIRFTVPTHEIRTILWRELVPPNAPLSNDVDYNELGRKFELGPRGISYSIARACSHAIIRIQDNNNNNQKIELKVCQKDLLKGGEAEVSKLRSGNMETLSKMFL